MTDYAPIDPLRTRSPRIGLIVALVALAFAAGLLLAGYAVRHLPWFASFGAEVAPAAPARAATGGEYLPANPLDANGNPSVTADAATLATREAALAGQLTALETRTAVVTSDASAAAGQATRAEGLLVAFAARRALDRGLGLGYLEEQLRTRFGTAQPAAVATIIEAARQPLTLEALRQGLDAVAPNIATVSDDSWWRALRRELGTLVVLRKAGTPSPLPADRLARAKRLLDGGQVEAARAEVARLPGAGDAANWTAAAGRYISARDALDRVESAAILGQGAQPSAAPVTTGL
ncbi:MAG TPA: hypothetical protein VM900_10765 [Sphingomonas sp.]|jgi:hypothetical protein|nr:hypothetical protein [Sphingomonas sp.]